jgi:hypothetical protein
VILPDRVQPGQHWVDQVVHDFANALVILSRHVITPEVKGTASLTQWIGQELNLLEVHIYAVY